MRCTLGIHKWSGWGDPVRGEKTLPLLEILGGTPTSEVEIQGRTCKLCNKLEFREAC